MRDFAKAISVLMILAGVGQFLFACAILVSAAIVSGAGREALTRDDNTATEADVSAFQDHLGQLTQDGLLWLAMAAISGLVAWWLWRWGSGKNTTAEENA